DDRPIDSSSPFHDRSTTLFARRWVARVGHKHARTTRECALSPTAGAENLTWPRRLDLRADLQILLISWRRPSDCTGNPEGPLLRVSRLYHASPTLTTSVGSR